MHGGERRRRSPARGTPPRSPTGPTTCARIAFDAAGNSRTTATVASRVLDNTAPGRLRHRPGHVPRPRRRSPRPPPTRSASPTSVDPVQRRRARTAGRRSARTTRRRTRAHGTPPALADGAYDVRAIATDTAGNQATSALGGAYVNNTGPTGTDVQGTNGARAPTTSSTPATPSPSPTARRSPPPRSSPAGTAASTAIRVRVANNGATDSMEFYDAANTTALGLLKAGTALAIEADYVTGASLFSATIVRSGSTVTVTIGSLISGAVTTKARGKSPMTWQTSSQATASRPRQAGAAVDGDRVRRQRRGLLDGAPPPPALARLAGARAQRAARAARARPRVRAARRGRAEAPARVPRAARCRCRTPRRAPRSSAPPRCGRARRPAAR